jgi:polysaccharide pyruvyl transferase WcaK-like protein
MDRLPALMARLLSEDDKIRLRVVVTSVGAADSDLNVSWAFVAAVQNIARNRCELTVFNGDPEQFLSIFSRAALIIAMRFHVAIAAAAMEVPTIWVPYQRKVLDGAASLDVPDEFVVFPNGELAAKLLYRKAKSFLSQRTPAMAGDLANAFANADRNIKLITREIGEDI